MSPGFGSDQADYNERIYGKGIKRLFRELIESKTIVRIFLLGKNYERLTVVTDLEDKDSEAYFTVDYPSGFKRAIEGIKEWRLRFEFTGKDRLPYIFRTEGGELAKEGIRLRLPKFVERRQRRKSFRLEAPGGTKLVFTKGLKNYETNVINISLGGALVSLDKRERKKPLLEVDEYIKGIKVIFPSKGEQLLVHIKEAMVKRVEKDIYKGLYNCALQFTDMEKKEIDFLQKLIYQFQREYLRKKRLLDV